MNAPLDAPGHRSTVRLHVSTLKRHSHALNLGLPVIPKFNFLCFITVMWYVLVICAYDSSSKFNPPRARPPYASSFSLILRLASTTTTCDKHTLHINQTSQASEIVNSPHISTSLMPPPHEHNLLLLFLQLLHDHEATQIFHIPGRCQPFKPLVLIVIRFT